MPIVQSMPWSRKREPLHPPLSWNCWLAKFKNLPSPPQSTSTCLLPAPGSARMLMLVAAVVVISIPVSEHSFQTAVGAPAPTSPLLLSASPLLRLPASVSYGFACIGACTRAAAVGVGTAPSTFTLSTALLLMLALLLLLLLLSQ